MSLKSNSKQARENVRAYIRKYSEDYISEYRERPVETDSELLRSIYEIFREEKNPDCAYYSRFPESVVFEDWASGLALGGLFCYYYNRSAVDDLGAILNESETEKARFSEQEAEKMLTQLIYNEVRRAVK